MGIDLKEECDVKSRGEAMEEVLVCAQHTRLGSAKELCLTLLPFLPTLVRVKGSPLSVLIDLSLAFFQLANKLILKFGLIWVRIVWPL